MHFIKMIIYHVFRGYISCITSNIKSILSHPLVYSFIVFKYVNLALLGIWRGGGEGELN